MKKQVKDRNILIAKGIMVLVIALVVLYDLNREEMIFITSDELGYWGAAAYFAKLDWSGVTSMWPYYAYGYGFLLAPILLITHNAVIAYKAAIVLNAVLLCGTFWLLDGIMVRLLPKWNRWMILLCTFAAALYSSAVFFAHMTMAEPVLAFGFCLLVRLFLRILEKPRKWCFAASAVLLSYLYMVHLRMIVIVIAFVMVLIVLLFTKKIKWSDALLFLVIMAIGLGAGEILRGQVTQALYTNKDLAEGNSYAAQVDKVASAFSLEGIQNFLMSILGKIYYLGSASFLLFYWGVWFLIKKLKDYVLCLKERRGQQQESAYLFLMLSFLGLLAISAITMMDFGRIDILMYGRYIEFMNGPILVCGLYELYENRNRWKLYIVFAVIQLALTGMAYGVLTGIESEELVFPSIIGVYGMAKVDGVFYKDMFVILTVVKSLLLAAILCFILCYRRGKKWMASGVLGMAVVWVIIGITPLEEAKDTAYQQASQEVAKEILKSNEDEPIYYVANEKDENVGYDYTYIAYLQFLLPDMPITCVSYEELEKLEKPQFVITMANSSDINQLMDDYTMVYMDRFGLFSLREKYA